LKLGKGQGCSFGKKEKGTLGIHFLFSQRPSVFFHWRNPLRRTFFKNSRKGRRTPTFLGNENENGNGNGTAAAAAAGRSMKRGTLSIIDLWQISTSCS